MSNVQRQPTTNLHSATHAVIADGLEINCVDGYGENVYSSKPVAIAIGQSGVLVVELLDGTELELPAMPNGFVWNLQVAKVLADDANTTASDIVVLWNRRVQELV